MTHFARDVPRCVELVVTHARALAGDGAEVTGGMRALQRACRHDTARGTRMAVREAEAHKLMRRVGYGRAQRVFVEAIRNNPSGLPEALGGLPGIAQTGCRRCQPHYRSDRAWQPRALELFVMAQMSIPDIAIAVDQLTLPLPGDPPTTGLVFFLLAEVPEIVPPQWKAAYVARVEATTRKAGGGSSVAGVLSQAVRQARRARKTTREGRAATRRAQKRKAEIESKT